MVGAPRNVQQTSEYTVIHGLRAAIEALAEATDFQKEYMQKQERRVPKNRGRVIVCTSARDNSSMTSLEKIFHQVLIQQNSISSSSKNDQLLNIDFCHLVIINLYPGTETLVTNRAYHEIGSILGSEIHSCASAKLPKLLMSLILRHYNLASTTVTNIPMKEEQNSSSSANYDVEIFHESTSHSVFVGAELPRSIKDGFDYETVTLKWCTPRSGVPEMQNCVAQNRITPVDVTSRPSSCLINFLLSGRSVLLEMPRKTGGKVTSHLLSAHGGEIFIHSLNTSRSVLEDAPSISEGIGGKVANYRIPDFIQTALQQRLVPLKMKYPDENLGKARAKVAKMTKYWPLTFNSSVVYNIRQYLEPILVVTQKEDLTEEEVITCQQCIYQLVGVEARHDLVLNNQRIKGNKKEDQYRLMWNELEVIVGLNGKSAGHKAILQCIRKVRSTQTPESSEKMEIDTALGGLRKMLDINETSVNVLRSSPLSPTPLSSKSLKHRATMTLYDIILAKELATANKRIDFSGRLATPEGQIATLYPHSMAKEQSDIKS